MKLRVAAASTRLSMKLVARVPRTWGKGTKLVMLGHLKRNAGAGVVHFKIRLTAKEQRQLGAFARTTLRITVRAVSANAATKTLRAAIFIRR
jgi:hypothetical protein